MIEAKHSQWAHTAFQYWLKNFLLKDFSAIYLLTSVPEVPTNKPLILAPNHSTWYDGFIPYWVNEQFLQRNFYIVMLEEQLKRYWFFNKLGAIGIKPDSPADIKASMNYLNSLLQPKNMIVYFPQGKIIPDIQGKFELTQGLRLLSAHSETEIMPMRIKIEPLNQRKPALFLSFDLPIIHKDYKENPELLVHSFQHLQMNESQLLSQGKFGTCIYGNPHVGI
jgi:1-acyl-sn-glycerol-3-phosphate acyltransferase